MAQPNAVNQSELEWIQLRKELSQEEVETSRDKFIRKFKQNPLVPVGCLATAGVLSYGLYCFRVGDRKMSQMMMRARIVAQGFTVAALVIGCISMMSTNKKSDD